MKQIPVMQEALTEHLTQRSVTLRHSLLRSCAHRVLPSFLFFFFFVAAFKSGVKNARRGGTKAQIVFFKKGDPGG